MIDFKFSNDSLEKVINSFCVVGLDSSSLNNSLNNSNNQGISTTTTDYNSLYVQRIDIIKYKSLFNETVLSKNKNLIKMYRLSTNSDYWLRLIFTNIYDHLNPPITDVKFFKGEFFNNEFIVSLSYISYIQYTLYVMNLAIRTRDSSKSLYTN